MQPYLPFLMLLGLAIVIATTMIVGSHFLGPRRPTEIKERPYESGMPPLGSAHERFKQGRRAKASSETVNDCARRSCSTILLDEF